MAVQQRPVVSVITVVYNAVCTIERTIKSVLAQDFSGLEYIVIDGGSTDGTVEIIKKYCNRLARFVSEKDGGIYDAMNKGIQYATGEWIGIMNAGDVYASKDVLERVFSTTSQYEGCDVLYGHARAIDGNKVSIWKAGLCVEELLRHPIYRHGASFVRRETHLKYMFDLSSAKCVGYALDYLQIRTMYKNGCKFCPVDVMIVDYEKAGASDHVYKSIYYVRLIAADMQPGITGYVRIFCSIAFWWARNVLYRLRKVIG